MGEPLHFKTISTGILVGHDVKDYLKVHPDWYKNTQEQTHVTNEDWKYVDVTLKSGKVRQMNMGYKLVDEEIREYSVLIDELATPLRGRTMNSRVYQRRWKSIVLL